MNAISRTSPFVHHALAVPSCRSRSQPRYAQRPSRVSARANVAALAPELPARRPTLLTSQRMGYACLVLAIVLVELYAMRQIYLQLSNVPVQVQLTFDPADVFQGR